MIDTSTSAGKILETERKADWMAYAALALACEEAVLKIVKELMTINLLDGDVVVAWKNLLAKYKPATNMSHVQLRKEFAQCKLWSNMEDPNKCIQKFEHLRSCIKTAGKDMLSNGALMAQV